MRVAAALVVLCAAGLSGCGAGEAASATSRQTPPTTVTVTVPVTSTVTTTHTVTTTKRVTVTISPASPSDVTVEFRAKARSNGMDSEQIAEIVAVELDGNVATVLTTMRDGWGGWDCSGTPKAIDGVRLRYVTILYSSRLVFRDCSLT